MKKKELIHLHDLLDQTKENIEDTHDVPDLFEVKPELGEEYNSLNVKPTSIHKSKQKHKSAIKVLSRLISESIDKIGTTPEAESNLEEVNESLD